MYSTELTTLAIVATLSLGTLIYRLLTKRPIFARLGSQTTLFDERWSNAGYSKNSVRITITESQLIITPHFPFTLLPNLCHDEHLVPLGDLESLRIVLQRGRYRHHLSYFHNGTLTEFQLTLKDYHGFTEQIIAAAPQLQSTFDLYRADDQ